MGVRQLIDFDRGILLPYFADLFEYYPINKFHCKMFIAKKLVDKKWNMI